MKLRNWFGLGVLLAMAGCSLGIGGCALSRLPNVPKTISGPPASPNVLAAFGSDEPVSNAVAWQERRVPLLRAAFAGQIYGPMPETAPTSILSRQLLQAPTTGKIAKIERISVRIGVPDTTPWTDGGPVVDMILMTPRGEGPFPVLAGGTFCGNDAALPKTQGVRTGSMPLPRECDSNLPAFVVEVIFGLNANKPPFEKIAAAGYALAFWHPGDVAPDVAGVAEPFLRALTPKGTRSENRTGAIMAWAWTSLRMVDVLSKEQKLDPARVSLIGHSRHGKSALLAAAFDPRIASVWSLQSGTAGAALSGDSVGEPVADITRGYPHWFAPNYRASETQILDQHQLIAMIAPRPILIGTGRRDQWGDPHGSYRALVGASPAYELFGAPPFVQQNLSNQATTGPLSFYMRGGLHGIHSEDWREALAFFGARDPRTNK